MNIALNATSQSIDIRIVDDSGLPVTGLVAATLPTLTYNKAGANADVTITPVDLATLATAWTSSGVKERGDGVYRLDLPNAVFTAATRVTLRGETTDKRVICPVIEVGMLVPATVTFSPVTTTINDRVTASTITCYYGEAGFTIGPNAVTDSNGDPVNISGSGAYTSLRFTIQDQYDTDVLSTTSVTVSGASNNQWTVTGTSAVTATAPKKLKWSLRGLNTGVDVVLGLGDVIVASAAKVDA
jgi:hypothetical protein